MLIRSQNKAFLLNFSNLSAIYTVKNGDDFIILSLEGENKCTLGKYSIKVKTMKVLDMIQEAYADEKLVDYTTYLQQKEIEKMDDSTILALRNELMKKAVFQMPEDGSVEV